MLDEEDRKEEDKQHGLWEELAYRAFSVNPNFSTPVRPGEEREIELHDGGSMIQNTEDESDDSHSFSRDLRNV